MAVISGSLIVIGHFGHWYISLPVYLGPALAIVLWLWLGDRRARARAAADGSGNTDGTSSGVSRAARTAASDR